MSVGQPHCGVDKSLHERLRKAEQTLQSLGHDRAGAPHLQTVYREIRDEIDKTLRQIGDQAHCHHVEPQNIYDTAPIGLCVLDAALRFVRVNNHLAHINGVSPANHIDKTIRHIMPELADLIEPALRKVLETGEPATDHEISGVTPAMPGVRRHWLVSMRPLKDAAGLTVAINVVVQESTRQKLTEQRLCEETAELQAALEKMRTAQEEMRVHAADLAEARAITEAQKRQYQELFHFAPDAYLVTDLQSRISEANRAAGELFKMPWRELINLCLGDFVASEMNPAFYERLARLSDAGQRDEWQLRMTPFGRPPFDASLTIAPIKNAEGKATAFRWIIHNITPQKQLEMQLEQAKNAAESANKTKDHFLATLSHELRTPLTPVLLTAQTLATRHGLPDDIRRDMEMIRHNMELEARLIDDLLDLTRLAHGKFELHPQMADAHELIEQALDSCSRGHDTRHLRFVTQFEACRHHLRADPTRVQQIIWNLLNNAIKFTPSGGAITIRTFNSDESTATKAQWERDPALGIPQPAIFIEITDTGIGIDPDRLPLLFNAFQQGSPEVTRRFGGLGLGLALCKAIASLHQGSIRVRSDGLGKGCAFTVELPTVPPPFPVPLPVEPPRKPHRNLNILLVDDHQSTAVALGQIIQSMGHHVQLAYTFASALATPPGFELLISDLGLPDGDGLDLLSRLRMQNPNLIGIALSGYGMEDDIRHSAEAGYVCHLIKPVNIETLEAAIDAVTA